MTSNTSQTVLQIVEETFKGELASSFSTKGRGSIFFNRFLLAYKVHYILPLSHLDFIVDQQPICNVQKTHLLDSDYCLRISLRLVKKDS